MTCCLIKLPLEPWVILFSVLIYRRMRWKESKARKRADLKRFPEANFLRNVSSISSFSGTIYRRDSCNRRPLFYIFKGISTVLARYSIEFKLIIPCQKQVSCKFLKKTRSARTISYKTKPTKPYQTHKFGRN